jgi:hypothetical protein
MENKNESKYLCFENPPVYWKTTVSRVITNMKQLVSNDENKNKKNKSTIIAVSALKKKN